MNTQDLRTAARAVFLACPEPVAHDLADRMNGAAHEIDRLRNELSAAEKALGEAATPPQYIRIGPFTISRTRTPGKLHIRCGEGEGGEMPEEDFEKMVEQYYMAHF